MRELIAAGFLGELREVHVFGLNAALADPAAPLSWRQDAALSGFNMLTLGILHETLLRWVPPPVRVLAQVHAFIADAHRPGERRAPAGRHARQRAGAGRAGERRPRASTSSAA